MLQKRERLTDYPFASVGVVVPFHSAVFLHHGAGEGGLLGAQQIVQSVLQSGRSGQLRGTRLRSLPLVYTSTYHQSPEAFIGQFVQQSGFQIKVNIEQSESIGLLAQAGPLGLTPHPLHRVPNFVGRGGHGFCIVFIEGPVIHVGFAGVHGAG